MIGTNAFRDLDFTIFISTLLLIIVGLLTLYSATYGSNAVFLRQLWWILIGLFVATVFFIIPLRFWSSFSFVFYFLSLVLLVLVLLKKGEVKRWLTLGPLSFQPSEFAKLSTSLFLAGILSMRKLKLQSLKSAIPPILVALLPFLLVIAEPDLGTSLIFLFFPFCMLFYRRMRLVYHFFLLSPIISAILGFHWILWGIYMAFLVYMLYKSRIPVEEIIPIFLINLAAGLLNPFVWQILKPYQKARLFSFIAPKANVRSSGWQLIQSKIAIGSGGIWGKGFLMGTQKGLAFLPQRHTDFAFSSFSEEFGFIGSVFVLILFSLIIFRSLILAKQSRNLFASTLAIGIASIFLFHIVVNLGMTMGILPVVGMPLPFISYGGSSLVTSLAMVGLLLNIGKHRYEY
jgi:rod shape determining protein RodA